jgi:DNA-binding NtrC family response regulator
MINILLVDDDVDIISFQRTLKKTGLKYELEKCKNAEETIEAINKYKYSCFF